MCIRDRLVISHTQIQIQTLSVFLIIVISYALQAYYGPYLSEKLNQLERLSLISSGLVIYSGVYLLAYSREGSIKNIQRAILIYFSIVAGALCVFVIPWVVNYRAVVTHMIEKSGVRTKVSRCWDFILRRKPTIQEPLRSDETKTENPSALTEGVNSARSEPTSLEMKTQAQKQLLI
eukprot:TRINITY_DN3900_c0_g1_i4.p1 TRINITY_DN3900_c0_g1~~TRINITY_DN3900_c0_g1_i4.p1  ORF type:complete len:206 (+),score=31.05 TRINITY_DN3900_c0_g1_i4:89-619(+)